MKDSWPGFGRCPCEDRRKNRFFQVGSLLILWALAMPVQAQQEEGDVSFDIRGYAVEGNTIFQEERIREILSPFTGAGLSAEDVEKARAALEKAYHESGYISVMVNIPVPQTLEDGIVKLQVIESTVSRIRVTGNRYFTRETILRALPSLAPGSILYTPKIQEELNGINRNPDIKVAPVLMPGRDMGTVEVELKVKDRLPVHGSVEINNRSIHDTTDLRLNAILRYDNLWQREHSVSLQYQTSPQDPKEVQVVAGSYLLPMPWNRNHILALYGIWSDSETAFGEGFEVVGQGQIVGARYIMALPSWQPPERFWLLPARLGSYGHTLSMGLDYKDLDETLGFLGEGQDIATPVTYLPLSFAYNVSLPDSWGGTRFSAMVNLAFRGLVTDREEFEDKRFKARGNYLYSLIGAERTQNLPAGMSLFLKLDGQYATEPLISSEQYMAGGMESVRGYKENELVGDHALHGVAALNGPELASLFGLGETFGLTPRVFYDRASLWLRDPLPGQCRSSNLQGVGLGVRGNVTSFVEFEVDWAVALTETERTNSGDSRIHFRVKGQF